MDIHFNAFISYRHHPDDIRVAMQVHRALERYHIPRSLKKKLNVRGPMRLFRDKEELPITSNLNDDIGDALRNSDYLIVICSVHTKESIWVQREIELFLKSHHRSRVLTVLASGEPYDVIPEILLYEDKVDPVTGETVREMVEPLSCDWRLGLKKAKREELPRLAAPLLGCAYDELRQRQRQYRMHRMITFFSLALVASLGFSGYVLRNSIIIQRKNVEIQANLEASQRNQSRHLATAAAERLAEGDRLTAIALASAALPSENNVRPYVPEAENALTEALGIYQQYTDTVAAGTVSPGSQAVIYDFQVSPSGNVLFLRDDRGCVTTWDTATLQQIGTWDLRDNAPSDTLYLPDDNTLLRLFADDSTVLRCVTPAGEVVWEWKDCYDVALVDGGEKILVIVPKGMTDNELLYLDPATGKQLGQPVPVGLPTSLTTSVNFFMKEIPSNFPIPLLHGDYFSSALYLLDPKDGTTKELPVITSYPDETLVTNDGKLVVMAYAESDSFTGIFEGNRVNAPMRRQVCCYDPETAEQLWQTQIDSSVSGNSSLNKIPNSNLLLCQGGPVFQVVDAATGETVNRCEAGSGALCVTMGEQYAQAILEDGYLCNYWYYENYCYEDQCLQSGLESAQIHTDYYSLRLGSNHVTVYRRQDAPTSWNYKPEYAIAVRDQRICGSAWAVADINALYLMDLEQQTMRWSLELSGVQLLDFSQDGSKIWVIASDGTRKLMVIDTATGEYSKKDLANEEYTNESVFTKDGCLYYTVCAEEQIQVFWLELETGDTRQYDLKVTTEAEQSLPDTRVVGQWGDYLWIWCDNGEFLELDMNAGSTRILAEEVENCPVVAVREDGSLMAATCAEQVLLLTPGMEEISTVALEDVKAGGIHFLNGQLLVLLDNGFLHRYDEAGNLLSRTELTVGDYFDRLLRDETTEARLNWQQTTDGKLVVNACGTGNVIDMDSWKVATVVPGYHLYYGADDSFAGYNSAGFVGYPHYSVPELLTHADTALKNFALTEDQKLAYGID